MATDLQTKTDNRAKLRDLRASLKRLKEANADVETVEAQLKQVKELEAEIRRDGAEADGKVAPEMPVSTQGLYPGEQADAKSESVEVFNAATIAAPYKELVGRHTEPVEAATAKPIKRRKRRVPVPATLPHVADFQDAANLIFQTATVLVKLRNDLDHLNKQVT
jgi:hypothetical protein